MPLRKETDSINPLILALLIEQWYKWNIIPKTEKMLINEYNPFSFHLYLIFPLENKCNFFEERIVIAHPVTICLSMYSLFIQSIVIHSFIQQLLLVFQSKI